MIKRLKLTILSLLVSVGIFASETSVKNEQGIEIWYEFDTDTKWACVRSAPSKYSGNVIIPATVVYQGETYKVTVIGEDAFRDCSNLTSVTIPESVIGIDNYAFNDCSNLTSVTIPESVIYIGKNAFEGCSSLTSITIPEEEKRIESSAFEGCSSLTSVTIPESVTSIGYKAFKRCNSLTSVTIPESVTSIEWGTFCGCSSLTSVTIPEGVTSIGEDAFYNCTNITSITCKCIIPPMAKSAFGDFDTSIPLFVPEESIELYRNTNSWKKFTNIHPIPTDWTPLIIGAIVFAVVCVLIGLWIGKRKK